MIRSPMPRPATEPRAVGHNRRTCAFCLLLAEEDKGLEIDGEWWSAADREYGKPCLICGAPVNERGEGHDPGCMGLTD